MSTHVRSSISLLSNVLTGPRVDNVSRIYFSIWSSVFKDMEGAYFVQRSQNQKDSKYLKDICGYFQCAPFPRLQTGKVVWVLSFDP